MIHGSINNICLSTSSFERIITEGKLYVDKARVIEYFLNDRLSYHDLAKIGGESSARA